MNEFEQERARRSRAPVAQGVVLWVVALVSAIPVGVAVGLASIMNFLGLIIFVEARTGRSPLPVVFQVGYWATLAFVVVGVPVAAVMADRLGPWVTGARPADPNRIDHRAIVDTMETVGLALGIRPVVYVVEAGWLNVAALGRRGARPVVITTAAAAELTESEREVLAAVALSESLSGRGANRLWLAARAPALIPAAALRVAVRRFWALPLFIVVQSLLAAFGAGAGWFFGLPFLVGPFLVGFYGIVVLWLVMLSTVARSVARRSHGVADVGALGLLRHPEQWHDAFATFARFEPGTVLQRSMLEWLLPVDDAQRQARHAALLEAVPAARFSLAARPAPATE